MVISDKLNLRDAKAKIETHAKNQKTSAKKSSQIPDHIKIQMQNTTRGLIAAIDNEKEFVNKFTNSLEDQDKLAAFINRNNNSPQLMKLLEHFGINSLEFHNAVVDAPKYIEKTIFSSESEYASGALGGVFLTGVAALALGPSLAAVPVAGAKLHSEAKSNRGFTERQAKYDNLTSQLKNNLGDYKRNLKSCRDLLNKVSVLLGVQSDKLNLQKLKLALENINNHSFKLNLLSWIFPERTKKFRSAVNEMLDEICKNDANMNLVAFNQSLKKFNEVVDESHKRRARLKSFSIFNIAKTDMNNATTEAKVAESLLQKLRSRLFC